MANLRCSVQQFSKLSALASMSKSSPASSPAPEALSLSLLFSFSFGFLHAFWKIRGLLHLIHLIIVNHSEKTSQSHLFQDLECMSSQKLNLIVVIEVIVIVVEPASVVIHLHVHIHVCNYARLCKCIDII